MATLPSKRNYVPAQPDSWLLNWLRAVGRELRAFFGPQPARSPQLAARSYEVPAIRVETPPEVWRARDHAKEARRLLHRYLKRQPTSRRACMASGMSHGGWERARRTLMRAGIIDRKGDLIYYGRDAQLRLDIYLDGVERRCYQSGRYVNPS